MNELHDDVDINKLYLKKELLNKINEIKIGRKIFEQQQVINNLENFYKSIEEVHNFFGDYTKMVFVPKSKAKHGTGLKILTPKKMLHRLGMALAQAKAGNYLVSNLVFTIHGKT